MNVFKKKVASEMRLHLENLGITVPLKCTKADMINLYNNTNSLPDVPNNTAKRKSNVRKDKTALESYVKKFKTAVGEPLEVSMLVDDLKNDDGDDACIISTGSDEYMALKQENYFKVVGTYKSAGGDMNTVVKLTDSDVPNLLTNRLSFDIFAILKKPEI